MNTLVLQRIFTHMRYTKTMRFIKGTTEQAVSYIAERIRTLLASDKSVLWLVSGGSNIPLQVAVMERIPDSLSKDLTIMPVDERYGPYNHPDSNCAQIRRAGFESKHAECVDILEEGRSADDTVRLLNDFVAREIAIGDYVFATLGMGPDGHTAGILPHSPALSCSDLAMYYKGSDFMRITLCADTIAQHSDEIVLSAFGEEKHDALRKLAGKDDEREIIPAMLLRETPNSTVFNDLIEGNMV